MTAAVGFWFGLALVWLWTFLELPVLTGGVGKAVRFTAAALTIAFLGYSLWRGEEWQGALREFLGLGPLGSHVRAGRAPGRNSACACAQGNRTLRLLGKSKNFAAFSPDHAASSFSIFIGILLAAYLLTNLVSGTIGRVTLESLDAMFLALDQLIDPELAPPSEDLATGSAKSLIAWEKLGRQGRHFVASGPGRETIEEVTGSTAMRPLRVYVGLGAAGTPEERANLALEELKRVGAFDCSVLL